MYKLFNAGDTVGIISCSNGYPVDKINTIYELEDTLKSLGLKVQYSNYTFGNNSIFNGTDLQKADSLNNFFLNDNIKGIFDISGGDLSNGLLPYIDFDIIKKHPKPFFGYSDLSVILNSLYKQSNISTYLYQIRNLVGKNKKIQQKNFIDTFFNGDSSLFNFDYKFIQGEFMDGIVVGGNLRCTLKLAGTKYIPDFNNKILLLESLGGDPGKITTYLNQYKQIGAFDNLNGVILGTFTEMESNAYSPSTEDILSNILPKTIPIIKTYEIGHSDNSKCISIGRYYRFKK